MQPRGVRTVRGKPTPLLRNGGREGGLDAAAADAAAGDCSADDDAGAVRGLDDEDEKTGVLGLRLRELSFKLCVGLLRFATMSELPQV